MIALAIGVLGVIVTAASVAVIRSLVIGSEEIGKAIGTLEPLLDRTSTDNLIELNRRIMALEDSVDRLPQKWEDIKRESQSLYNRSRHHVRRIAEELESRGFEDPEVTELASQLQLLDGGGSEPEAVPTVSEGVEDSEPQTPAEDWETQTMRFKYGG